MFVGHLQQTHTQITPVGGWPVWLRLAILWVALLFAIPQCLLPPAMYDAAGKQVVSVRLRGSANSCRLAGESASAAGLSGSDTHRPDVFAVEGCQCCCCASQRLENTAIQQDTALQVQVFAASQRTKQRLYQGTHQLAVELRSGSAGALAT